MLSCFTTTISHSFCTAVVYICFFVSGICRAGPLQQYLSSYLALLTTRPMYCTPIALSFLSFSQFTIYEDSHLPSQKHTTKNLITSTLP
ncbi:hypothetical protein B0H13DRAFT_278278 [Mycena leptocephala]|nr:hypothetical protein B0H13DRAFT_278278 [Mycena leptocephala]